jgi:hypothetical protein
MLSLFLSSKVTENATAKSNDQVGVSDETIAFLEVPNELVWNAMNFDVLS